MDHRQPVESAFEQLLSALGAELAQAEHECLAAMEEHDLANLDRTRRLVDRVAGIKSGLLALQRGWRSAADDLGSRRRRYLGRLEAGKLTHRSAFRTPILLALERLGGRAEAEQALAAVEALMQDVLNGSDYQTVPSRPQCPRWRNACHSARHDLVREGLLRGDVGRGVWALSDAGREAAGQLGEPASPEP
jgi:hypothetical protein